MQFKAEGFLSIFDVGVAGAFGMLHFLLYIFYPREKSNLYFSIFAVGVALRALSTDVFEPVEFTNATLTVFNVASELSLSLAVFAFGKFLYAAFEEKTPFQFWLTLILWTLSIVLHFFAPATFGKINLSDLLLIAFIIIESVRVVGRAIVRGNDGARIVGFGVLLVLLAPLKDGLQILSENDGGFFWNTFFNQISICGIIVANSFYLARKFAKTNFDLENQLEQVKQLSAREIEHERTAADLRLQNEQERARLALVEQELDLAASIQQALFPEELLKIEGYDVAAFNRAAKVCGGDYYDALRLNENSVLFCVADVNAGHNECVLLGKDGEALLKSTGLPLGMLGGMVYEEKSLQINAGDIIALYSDGVPEAYDETEQEWGEERLNALLKRAKNYSASAISEKIVTEIDAFAADAPQHDDITLLIIKSSNEQI